MPYYITRESQECAGYAVVSVYEDQTELHGCHLTRQAAIDQMVAMSEEEGIEPGGDLDQIEETIEEDMAKPAPVVQLAAPVTIISFSAFSVATPIALHKS